MKNLFKPASLLLYLLAILVFFFLGMLFAGLTGAGKGQGLAGGAIVVGYGVMGAGMALLGAIYLAWQASIPVIIKINKVLGVGVLCFLAWVAYRMITGDGRAEPDELSMSPEPKMITAEAAPLAISLEDELPMGLGFFKPNFYENPVLYFYGNPTLEKGLNEHMATDSIVFKRLEVGGFDITYAPPWLVPDHLKLDYDMLYFRVKSLGWDFAEVMVNTQTRQTAYVNRYAGKIDYWPEFLLNVNSVEFLPNVESIVRVKPLDHAGLVETPFAFMRPMLVQEDWMYVQLQDDDFQTLGKGWIKWKENGQLRILYSLLS